MARQRAAPSASKVSAPAASDRFDHYIRVRPDYVHVQTPDDVFKEIGAAPNENPMRAGMQCKIDSWPSRGDNSREDDNTACSDPTGAGRAADKQKFNNACRRHDVCYSSPGGSQSNCDGQFAQDLGAICNALHDDGCGRWGPQLVDRRTGLDLQNCTAGGDRVRN